MDSEKFCLRWNDFETNISSAFRELRDDKDLFDVTLVCEDEQIQSHKVILSACSQFFRKILCRNPHQHPLLYLKGVNCSDLQSVLNFMYHGEVNVAQEQLNTFLAVAEDLKVNGLTQNQFVSQHPTQDTSVSSKCQTTTNRFNKKTDRGQKPPPPKQHTQPAPITHPSSSQPLPEEYDHVQQVLPIKTEPRESQSEIIQPATNYASTAVLEQPLAMYQEEEQEYEEYGEEQQYMEGEGNISMGNTLQGVPALAGRNLGGQEEEFETFLKENSVQLDGKTWSCYLCGKITTKSRGSTLRLTISVWGPFSVKFVRKYSKLDTVWQHMCLRIIEIEKICVKTILYFVLD